ncbi:MAG: bifunctional glycosyltransferase family 2/GtrA family protein [Patescibacteria group bacterium]
MIKKNISLSLFFPAYNEEKNIAASVKKAQAVLEQCVDQYEIIVVNDGSSDRTGDIIDELSRKDNRIRAIHQANTGYGGAVWKGVMSARYEYLFFTDADLQFDLDELPLLLAHVPPYHAVLGYRAKRQDPFMRLVNAKGWNMLNRLLFGLHVRDIDCAFKLFKTSVVQALPEPTTSAMMSAEILIRLSRKGIHWAEIPVTHLPRKAGVATGAKPAVIARALRSMWTLFWGDLGPAGAQQFARFAGVGIANTTIDLGLYTLLTRTIGFFGAQLLGTKVLSFLAGTVFSFIVNRRWTFQKEGSVRIEEVVRFYASVGAGLAINVFSLHLFHNVLGIHDLASALLATGASFIWNFAASKMWVFKGAPQQILKRA